LPRLHHESLQSATGQLMEEIIIILTTLFWLQVSS